VGPRVREGPGRLRRGARGVAGGARRLGSGVERAGRALSDGVPRGLVAVTAIVVLVLVLYTVATREPAAARGYAEFTMFRDGCLVAPNQRQNVLSCQQVDPLTYRLTFTKSLAGSTAVATRGTCCPGQVRASIETDRTVLVSVGRRPTRAHPVRASVFVP
jgi:hypothetical protein